MGLAAQRAGSAIRAEANASGAHTAGCGRATPARSCVFAENEGGFEEKTAGILAKLTAVVQEARPEHLRL